MRFVSHLESKCEGNAIPDSDLVDNCKDGNVNEWRSEVEEIRMILPGFAPKNSIEDLIRFCGIRKSNSFLMRKKDSGEVYGGQLIDLHARINNSCDPNCVSSHDGAESFLIALREIKPDEEITVAYCDLSMPRAIRQEYFKKNLFFDCKCALCSSNEFEAPEALRTAVICSCNQIIYDNAFKCPTCEVLLEIPNPEILSEFSQMGPIEKMKCFKDCQTRFHACHWINNKMADMLTQEFCAEPEYTKEVPSLLVDFKTGLIKGHETVTNPFVLLVRYEYALALIHRHPELYASGLLIASNYLKLASRIKGVDDELAQKFAVVSQKWSEYLKANNQHQQ